MYEEDVDEDSDESSGGDSWDACDINDEGTTRGVHTPRERDVKLFSLPSAKRVIRRPLMTTHCCAENELFLRLKAERKVVLITSSIARVAKFCVANKSLIIFD